MSKRFDPDDMVAMDKWLRTYYKIPAHESTEDFLAARLILSNLPYGRATRLAIGLAWIEPHAPEGARSIIADIKAILADFERKTTVQQDEMAVPGVIVMPQRPPKLPPRLTEVDELELEKGELLIEQAKTLCKLQPAVDAQERLKQAQKERASKHRKLTEEQAKRAAKAYHDIKEGRAAYGGVKELAREYGVSEATIRAAAKRYPPDSIDK
jgi:hypothetical protein